MLKYQIFIFNWKNQEQKVIQTIESLTKEGFSPIVINSDDTLRDKYDWVHVGEQAYFTEQFNTAISLFNADILFHIQGDATYDRWKSLINDSEKYFNHFNYGVYAPNVDFTRWTANNVNIKDMGNNVWSVTNTDCTCWFIHKDILKDFEPIDLSKNRFGWGIDENIVAISEMKNRLVLRDYNHTIDHPAGTTYDTYQATIERIYMIKRILKMKLKFQLKSTIDNIRYL